MNAARTSIDCVRSRVRRYFALVPAFTKYRLVFPQHNIRVQPRGAPCGKATGERGNQHNCCNHRRQGHGVGRLNAEEQQSILVITSEYRLQVALYPGGQVTPIRSRAKKHLKRVKVVCRAFRLLTISRLKASKIVSSDETPNPSSTTDSCRIHFSSAN